MYSVDEGKTIVSPFREGGKILESGATFSEDKKYRYEIHRIWDNELDKILFILLNPSTGDEDSDDNTTKRCIQFAKKYKYGGIYMANLYAHRSRHASLLDQIDEAEDPVGPDNKRIICEILLKVKKVVYAWGEKLKHMSPSVEPPWLQQYVLQPYCFKKTKDGYPYNPRCIPSNTNLIPFRDIIVPPSNENFREYAAGLPPLPPSPELEADGEETSPNDLEL